MPHQLWITALLNKYFAGVANAILGVFHLHSSHPEAPIPNYVAMQIVVFVFLVLVFLLVRSRLSVEDPGHLQQVFESINSMVSQQGHEIIGHGYERYVSYLTVLGLFILVCCLIGVIPGFETPTGIPSVPLGLALVTWFYYHFQGIRANGFGYVKNFIGPEPWLAFLVFFSLVPLILPVPFILLHIGVAVIQTYIFVLLATVYIGEAVAHEH